MISLVPSQIGSEISRDINIFRHWKGDGHFYIAFISFPSPYQVINNNLYQTGKWDTHTIPRCFPHFPHPGYSGNIGGISGN